MLVGLLKLLLEAVDMVLGPYHVLGKFMLPFLGFQVEIAKGLVVVLVFLYLVEHCWI